MQEEPRHTTTSNQRALEDYKDRFRKNSQGGSELLTYLERSGCGIWRCEVDRFDRRRWWLNITLPASAAEMFDVHLEVQVLYVEYEKVEPRLFEVIQEKVRMDPRVDRGVYVIASRDPNLVRMARRRRGEFAVIDLMIGSLGTSEPDLRQRMATSLTAVDHYDVTAPIKHASGFFGRKAEFDRTISGLSMGQSVGIFGLRKTGKTSLLNHVFAKRREAGVAVASLDISGMSGADDFRRRLVEGVFGALHPDGLDRGQMDELRLKTVNSRGESRGSVETQQGYWVRDIKALLDAAPGHVEVFIDEIDQAYPSRSYLGEEEATRLMVAITQLRGLVQAADQDYGLVLLCAGTDPALFERPILPSGADNLLYKLVRLDFLAPMSRDEMAEMVRVLGRRMGIRVRSHDVLDLLFAEYGGHPLLSRKACSLAASGRSMEHLPWQLSTSVLEVAIQRRGEGTPLQQAAEILESYSEWFPDEASNLRALWSDDQEERETAALVIADEPSSVAHAVAYGLLIAGGSKARVRAIERSTGGLASL